MALQDILAPLSQGAQAAGFEVTPIPGERAIRNMIHVRVNGKRCVARIATHVAKPPGNAFGYVRFIAGDPGYISDSAIKAIILIVAPPGECAIYYIIPPRDWKTLLREQGQSARAENGSAPVLKISHPPLQNSKHEPFRDNWAALA
ncbi:MAG: hypothetical protein V4682_02820 [Patescibacteria group bacterium]